MARAEKPTRLTRRQFAVRLAETAGVMTMGTTLSAEAAPAPQTEDPRIAQLGRERTAPLTPEQRNGLPAQLKDLDTTATNLRKFPLQDGGSEPCFVFHPILPPGKGK